MKMLYDMQYLDFSLKLGGDIFAPYLVYFEKVNYIGNDFQFIFQCISIQTGWDLFYHIY